jgi:hypothetical protein
MSKWCTLFNTFRESALRRSTFIAILVGLFCLANVTRAAFRNGFGEPRFVAEGAAHLRYTEMVAKGQGIPSLDRPAEWPEGLRVFEDASPAMEYVFGWTARLVPGAGRDLPGFIRFFSAFLFSLALFPVALLSARLWRSAAAGVLSGLLFAVVLPVVARSSGFEYVRENFTFPLLVYHVFFFVAACAGGSLATAILSGTFLFAALASWQGSQFYLVPLLLFLLARVIVAEIAPGERRAVRILVLSIAAAALIVPYLRAGRLLLSIPAALAAAYLVVDLLAARGAIRGAAPRREEKGRRPVDARIVKGLVAAGVAAAVLVPGLVSRTHFAAYSHFFDLVLYKLRYIRKPDPGLLPFDARAFWVGPFNSPDALHFFVFALPVILLLPVPVWLLAKRSRHKDDFEALFALVFLALFFALFLLMQRLEPLFGVFAAIAAGGSVPGLLSIRRARDVAKPSFAIAALVVGISLCQDFGFEGRGDIWRSAARALHVPSRDSFAIFPYARDVEGDLLSWIGAHTPPDAVVMSLHYLSPQVLTYTGRATNLNDFFESPRLRRKARRLLDLLYSSEENLYRFCASQSSTYLLISCAVGDDPTKDSPLYQAGLIRLPAGCAAYRLMFEPQTLEHFDLVYENEMYRLFAVGRGWSARAWPRSPLFYDERLLSGSGGDIRSFYRAVMRIYALTGRGRSLLRAGDASSGETALVDALHADYFYPAWKTLDGLYARQGRASDRASLDEFAYRYDPNRLDVCLALAGSRLALGKTGGVRDLLDHSSALPGAETRAAELRALLERLDAAK